MGGQSGTMVAQGRYTLSLSDFQATAGSTFKELLSDTHFADVTLVAEEENEILAHKVILASSSSFFRRILIKHSQKKPIIYLNGIRFSDLQAIVNFIYLGEVEVRQEHLDTFLKAAKVLEVKGITDETGNLETEAPIGSRISDSEELMEEDANLGEETTVSRHNSTVDKNESAS